MTKNRKRTPEQREKIKIRKLLRHIRIVRRDMRIKDADVDEIVYVLMKRVPKPVQGQQTVIRDRARFTTSRFDCPHCGHVLEVGNATTRHIKYCYYCSGRIITERKETLW